MRGDDLNVREAVLKSRNFIKDLYVNEPIGEVRVEEIELEEHEGKWYVTIGFIRLWDRPSSAIAEARGKSKESNRVHKSVGIRDSDGEVVSMTDRV